MYTAAKQLSLKHAVRSTCMKHAQVTMRCLCEDGDRLNRSARPWELIGTDESDWHTSVPRESLWRTARVSSAAATASIAASRHAASANSRIWRALLEGASFEPSCGSAFVTLYSGCMCPAPYVVYAPCTGTATATSSCALLCWFVQVPAGSWGWSCTLASGWRPSCAAGLPCAALFGSEPVPDAADVRSRAGELLGGRVACSPPSMAWLLATPASLLTLSGVVPGLPLAVTDPLCVLHPYAACFDCFAASAVECMCTA